MDALIVWQYLQIRLRAGLSRRGDAGVVTTETAVLAFVLVTGAIVVAGILVAAATSNANRMPNP